MAPFLEAENDMVHLVHTPLRPISNANPPPSLMAMPQKLPGEGTKDVPALCRCTLCHNVAGASGTYRWCEPCRIKKEEKRQKEKAHAWLKLLAKIKDAPTEHAVVAQPVTESSSSVSKATEIIRALGGMQPGKRKADEMEHSATVEAERVSRVNASQFLPDIREQYQLGSQLCGALSTTLKTYYNACLSSPEPPPYINFRGTYSIIADAKVPQWKRVEQVSTELRKVVKLPHSNKTYDYPMSSQSWTETFQCDCSRGRARPAPSPSPSASPTIPPPTQQSSQPSTSLHSTKPAPLKRTQSNLSHWILSASAKARTSAPILVGSNAGAAAVTSPSAEPDTVPGCGGKVCISVEDDNSHPLGIKGHKIVVVVEHSSAAVVSAS